MLPAFLAFGCCWGPVLHQVISYQFSNENYPDITEEQRKAFILGSIFADGIDKTMTHHINGIQDEIERIAANNTDSNIYWFLSGIFAHIPPDTFAHAGKSKSFIVSTGFRHRLSELVIDSLMARLYQPDFIELPNSLSTQLRSLGITINSSFGLLRRLLFYFSKLPFYRLLSRIQQNSCPKPNFDVSLCNFNRYYEAMMGSLWMSVGMMLDRTFTDMGMKSLATALLIDIECCPAESSDEDLDAPLLSNFHSPFVVQSL